MNYVFLAGIGNSGPDHWQYRWCRRVDGVWIEHESWDRVERDTWVDELDGSLSRCAGPKILIAHSLGCTLVAEWAAEYEDASIEGAFLVAVPDVHGRNFPADALGFGSPRYGPLPFRSVVVASEDDPYGSLEHSAAVAERFGASLVNLGRKGHINADSGLGDWDEGWSLFQDEFVMPAPV